MVLLQTLEKACEKEKENTSRASRTGNIHKLVGRRQIFDPGFSWGVKKKTWAKRSSKLARKRHGHVLAAVPSHECTVVPACPHQVWWGSSPSSLRHRHQEGASVAPLAMSQPSCTATEVSRGAADAAIPILQSLRQFPINQKQCSKMRKGGRYSREEAVCLLVFRPNFLFFTQSQETTDWVPQIPFS